MSVTLYSAGTCSSYRLGRPTSNSSNKIPTQVDINLKNVVCIAAGWQHNVIVYEDGSVYGWGSNTDGQLGLRDRENDNHPTQITALSGLKIIWAACGDKLTAFLTDKGDVYVATKKSPNNRPYKLRIQVPCVYCACSTSFVYAIGANGEIYRSQEDPTNDVEHYALPNKVYDIAAGDNFAIAVTVDHKAYGLGKLGESRKFIQIPSLNGINVFRVFGYNQHSAIITLDGKTFTWGNGSNGRLGHGNETNLDAFKLVDALISKKIVDIDMGDSHTIFIGSDGSVYSCGASDDGRLMLGESKPYFVPTRSPAIHDHAVYTTCGCFHTYILCGDVSIQHPGIKRFLSLLYKLPGPQLSIGNYTLCNDTHVLLSAGLFPGDLVKTHEYTGILLGTTSPTLSLLLVGNELKSVETSSMILVSRRGFVGVPVEYQDNQLIVDGGILLKSYGLELGEVIARDENRYVVQGVSGSQLFITPEEENSNKAIGIDETLQTIFAKYKLVGTKRNIQEVTVNGVNYPCEKIEPFYIHQMEPIEIFGTFAFYYVGRNAQNVNKFFKECDITQIETNGEIYANDTVLYQKHRGLVLSVGKDQSVIATEDITSKSGVAIVSNSDLTLLSRVIPGATVEKTLEGHSSPVKLSISVPFGFAQEQEISCLPSDLFVGDKGFVVVLGYLIEKEGELGTPYACLFNDLLNMSETYQKPFIFNPKEYNLVRRTYSLGNQKIYYNLVDVPIIVSASQKAMLKTRFLQGDEVLFDEVKAVILGISDHYLWMKNFEGEFVCVNINEPHFKVRIKLIQRPTQNFKLLL